DVRESTRPPWSEARLVRSAVRIGLILGDERVADRPALPLRMLVKGLRRRIEEGGAHPEAEPHRRDRSADGVEPRVREPRPEFRVLAAVPARLWVLRRVGLPVSRACLPAVVEDEGLDAQPAG